MPTRQNLSRLFLKDTSFVDLMTRRVFNILIVANPYDSFMLEDDGRIDEKLFDEYAALSLRYPPRFMLAGTAEEAWTELEKTPFDLVIVMPGTDNCDTFDIAREIKQRHESIPLVVLTPFSHGITARMEYEDLSIFEYVFCWLGNTDLLLSIIKLIEDKMNLDHDIDEVGVQMILLVEDNIRFYSSVLPELYKFVLQQSKDFATEALNGHQRTLRMRGRPKIVLARTYEEAVDLYERHPKHVLGVITDARYPKDGVVDPKAGVKLLAALRSKDPHLPLILQSAETENMHAAAAYNADFIDKNSKKMNIDLRTVVKQHFGFGDFVFRNPKTFDEVARVRNLKELQAAINTVPSDSLLYHITRNHVSRWLRSRAMFPLAEFIKQLSWESLKDLDAHRRIIFDAIVSYRKMKNQGVVAVFDRDRFDSYSNFARIGEGSLGGKGRGLAFIDNMIKRHPDLNRFDNAVVMIPKTVVLCTDVFEEFMDTNNLYPVALSEADDADILNAFRRARLPRRLLGDFLTYIEATRCPIAVRSSSLLEDSHYQPFAGIYNTYMVPYFEDRRRMLNMLSDAIKGVYASVYFKDSKAYMQATRNVIDQEKMAVILQEVVGRPYENRFYPAMSGVGRSLNYYPLGDERAEEGIVSLALGLGKYIVDGGRTLRVCPHHPGKVLQTSEMDIALRDTQTRFFALDLDNKGENFSVDDAFNLLRLPVKEAEKDGALQFIASTFDPTDQIIRPGLYPGGRKIVSFVGVLEHDVLPLPVLMQEVLQLSESEMRRPVEIEFAVDIDAARRSCVFYLLQVRPMVDVKSDVLIDLSSIREEDVLLRSDNSLGHGIMGDIADVVYVKTEGYSPSNNPLIAYDIERINSILLAEDRHCVLIGPGRWGSNDSWLGIPVKWPNISSARIIVEAGLSHYRVDPSQGTHFFQNLTSFGVGYFTVNAFSGDGVCNEAILNALPAVTETRFVRHVRFSRPLSVKIDGKKKLGFVLLPPTEV
ncbi:phosphoenolpyruvate synthase [Alloprevotella sp. OH1205_COT-284]|uniref:PEP/pyruvate-binding domain-containing protein n=1 Tax=Alloprevotella sp. OH1205_COT-284 TaxID=2491043 RepID=UPI000F602F9C|nr:PEP/pyruvate-binding domain-containing protein [Alloprevotella sp. OH1205_COT-284]RRD80016.1 phosphoenolpyruvate synthase [Alloprevotella sp. OH1205_COT-284]